MKRRKDPSDNFFTDGNIICRLHQEFYFPASFDEKILCKPKEAPQLFCCGLAGCTSSFDTNSSYEVHYASKHCNVCSGCKRLFPSHHLLDIHIDESHNPLFKDQYRCLVVGCESVFLNAKKRHKHLVEKHKYPSSFRFERSMKKKEKASSKQISGTNQIEMDIDESDICSEALKHSAQSPTVQPVRFSYSYKVPVNFSFGAGAQRVFHQKTSRRKNHLSSAKDSHKPDNNDSNGQSMDLTSMADELSKT